MTRMLVPRSVRHAAHPVRSAKRAATPKAVKQIRHAAHPLSNAVYGAERSLSTNSRTAAVRGCKTCGTQLPRGAPGGQRYCDAECREAHGTR